MPTVDAPASRGERGVPELDRLAPGVVDPSDWRLTNQMKYLKGVSLVRRQYRRYAKNPDWDHDHCSFCWEKFMEGDDPDMLHEGYATHDDYHWICAECFSDFKEMFAWTVTEAGTKDAP